MKSIINRLMQHFCTRSPSEYTNHVIKMEFVNILDCLMTFDGFAKVFIPLSSDDASNLSPKVITMLEKGQHKLGDHAQDQFAMRKVKSGLTMFS